MGNNKKTHTIGDIRIEAGISYQSVCDMKIVSKQGAHGNLSVVLEVEENTRQQAVSALKDQTVKVSLRDGERIFTGICVSAGFENYNGYRRVRIEAATRSYLMDKEKKDRTFQDTSKTLKSITDEIGAEYGARITIDSDVPLPEIVSQKGETDWAFLSRLAASQGKVLYADVLSEAIEIYIGIPDFRELGSEVLGEPKGCDRDGSELAAIAANEGSAEGYMVDIMEYETDECTAAAGTKVARYIIKKSEIRIEKGELKNRVSCGYPESVRPSQEESTQPGFANSILQGTVLAVAGNEIKVEFPTDSPKGTARWITYESSFSNNFYCMPDVGDTVFVYYENNGKAICLGSRHTDTSHPDMQKPEEKVITNKDKMIKFTTTGVKLTATRELTDNESDNAVSIEMDDEKGITITSGREILWESEKSIRLEVNAPADADEQAEKGREKLNARIKDGKESFQNEGGYLRLVGEQYIGKKIEMFKAGLENNVLTGWLMGGGDEPAPEATDAETFESGVLTLYGYQAVTMSVGTSSIELGTDIHIYADQFQWLGYEQREHEKQEQPLQDWWETALDGMQLVLDIAGCIPGVGFIPDLLNAGVSLMRGDIAGAALSAVASIPGIGDAIGAGKLAGKATKAAGKIVGKVIKNADTLKKVKKMAAIARGVYMMAQSAYSIYQTKDGWAAILQMWKEGKNPLTDPACVSTIINTVSGCVMFGRGAKGVSDATGTTAKIKKKFDGAKKKIKEKVKILADEGNRGNKKCKYDPIDVVTGSLMMEYTDMVLKDVGEDFVLNRVYESIYTNEGMMLGSKWFLNIETRLSREENRVTLQKPDMNLEHFRLEDGIWVNERAGDKSVTLTTTDKGYLFKESATGYKYAYDEEGQLLHRTDICGNKSSFEYTGGVLKRMTLASGQYLDFTFENGKLKRIQDIIGRKISYDYDGDLLTTVTFSNGGTIHYEYTNNGYIRQITDQNGKTYVITEYDTKGRATCQILATGEEYIMYYDDRNKRNTFTNPGTGECIVYEYGRQKVPLKEIHANGTYSKKRYDEWENCIYERDFNGNETFREYDENGNLLSETTPDQTVTTYTYNENNQILEKSDSTGAKQQWEYDLKGNMTCHRLRMGKDIWAVTTYTHDGKGRILTETNPNGNTIRYEYAHNFAEPTMKMLPEGETEWYAYDEAGRLMEKKNYFGTDSYGYNNRDRITSVKDDIGNTTRYRYDLLGNLLEVRPPVQEAAGIHGILYSYDALDRRIGVKTPEGNQYLYRYGNEECLTLSIHPNATAEGKEDGICYDYDEENRRIRAHYPDGGCERYFYDGNGNLIKKVTPECYDEKTDDGEGYTYTYDCMDRITSITNPMGEEEAAYTYDHEGRMISYREGKDMPESIYTYDYAGRLLSFRKPMDEAEDGSIRYRLITYQYDAMGNRISEKRYLDYQSEQSAQGRVNTITYTYNRSNLLIKVEDSTGAGMEYFYDKAGRLIKELIKIGVDTYQEIRYTLDTLGRVLKRCEKLEENAVYTGRIGYAITEFSYDANGNITGIALPEGGVIRYTYDNDNRLSEEIHEEKKGEINNHITYTYDHAGNLTEQTDADGNTTTYTHDLMDRETAQTNPDGGTGIKAYDRNGRLIQEVMPEEYAKKGQLAEGYRYAYDKTGRMVRVTAPDKSCLEQNTYDVLGRLVKQLEGATFCYDLAGRQIKVTTPEGNSQQFVYDAMGNMTATTDGLGNTTSFTVDEWGRITHITKADGSTECYTYDHAGNLLAATDGEDHTVTYSYNRRGLQESRTDAVGHTDHFRYDMEANLAESTDRNGNILHYTYNMYGSMTSRRSESGDINEAFGYYPDGKLKYAIGGGMRYDYRYDVMGRLTEKSASGRTLLSYDYDMNGNRTSMTDTTGKQTAYRYNSLDLLEEITDNGNVQARYAYNQDGTIKRLEVGNNLVTEYRYDADKNIISQKTVMLGMNATNSPLTDVMGLQSKALSAFNSSKQTLLTDNSYHYDRNANCIEKHTLSGLNRFTYDNVNQLVKAEYPTGVEEFCYDKAGNRTARLWSRKTVSSIPGNTIQTAIYGAENNTVHNMKDNALQPATKKALCIEETYHYDSTNRLISLDITNHVNGSKEQIHQEYTYDAQGNMLSDGNRSYVYDAMNRLTEVRNKDGNWQKNHYDGEGLRAELEENGRLVSFIFDKDKVVQETDADQNTIRYIRGYELISSDSEKARTYYHYACDELGSINHITDEEGQLLNRYEYDAFGNFTTKEETIENRFGFTGEQYDLLAGMYYLRARFYSPAIGRFIQEDTYYGDGLNLHIYCRNNPMMYVDPSGNVGEVKVYVKSRKRYEIVPGNANGFDEWFDSLTASDVKKIYTKKSSDTIKSRLRGEGGVHEWFMVSQAPISKAWGLTAGDIKKATTPIDNIEFIDIKTRRFGAQSGRHGNTHGTIEASVSTTAHLQIRKMMKTSKTEAEYVSKLKEWADKHLKVTLSDGTVIKGAEALPEYFRNVQKCTG